MPIKALLRPLLAGGVLLSLLLVVIACTADAPAPQTVEVTREVSVEITREVPVEVTKEVSVEITREVPVEVTKEVRVEVTREVMVAPAAVAMPGEGVTVRPGRANWNTGYFQEALYSLALEQLGYDVQEHQELDNAIFYQSLVQGDLDFWANGWFPLHDQFNDIWSQGAEIAGTVIKGGGVQGYLVDKASLEEFGITTLADFARPEVKAAFDHDGDGKADLYGCTEGWGCKNVIDTHISEFGLSDHINHNTAAYNAMFADVKSRFSNDESVLYYTWAPNYTLTQGFGLSPGSDVVWVEVPGFAHPTITDEAMVMVSGVDGCVGDKDPCFLGFAANDINVVANSEFLDANPAAKRLFEVMRLSLGDVLNQNNRMEAGEKSQGNIDDHAKEWAALNAEVWNGWLDEARSAAK